MLEVKSHIWNVCLCRILIKVVAFFWLNHGIFGVLRDMCSIFGA